MLWLFFFFFLIVSTNNAFMFAARKLKENMLPVLSVILFSLRSICAEIN